MTRPLGMDAEGSWMMRPSANPCLTSVFLAVATESPCNVGTVISDVEPPMYLIAMIAAASTTTTVTRATHGQIRRRRAGPPGPPSGAPYWYGGTAAVRPTA